MLQPPMRSSSVPLHVDGRAFRRHRRLRQLGYRDYGDYLRSPAWSDVKRRYRASDLPQACACGATERLQMHHRTYERVGEERLEDLAPMCEHCHTDLHVIEARGDVPLDFDAMRDDFRAAAYAQQARQRQERAEAAKPPEVRRAEEQHDFDAARARIAQLAKIIVAGDPSEWNSIVDFDARRRQQIRFILRHIGLHLTSLSEASEVEQLCRAVVEGLVTPYDAFKTLSALRGRQQAA